MTDWAVCLIPGRRVSTTISGCRRVENTGTDIAFYNLRKREKDELFPWDFIDIGVSRKFLYREWERAMAEEVTPNCRVQCSGCGAAKYGGGVCYEGKN